MWGRSRAQGLANYKQREEIVLQGIFLKILYLFYFLNTKNCVVTCQHTFSFHLCFTYPSTISPLLSFVAQRKQQNFFHIGQYLTLLMLIPNLLPQNCAWRRTLRLPPFPPTPVFSTYTALTLFVLTWVAYKVYSDGEAACSLNCPRGTIYLPHVLSDNYFPSMEKMSFQCYCQNLLFSSMRCIGINQNYKLGKNNISGTHATELSQGKPILF